MATAYEDDDDRVTTDGGPSLSTPAPEPRYQVYSREISDVFDPSDPADVNTRFIFILCLVTRDDRRSQVRKCLGFLCS